MTHFDANQYISRHVEPHVENALEDTRIVAIVGPRQAGKTTLARRISASRNRLYVSFDDLQARQFATDDPIGFLRLQSPFVIDEIQRVPELLLSLKQIVDMENTPGRFLITGSVDLFRGLISPDSLAGRVETIDLLPFSQAELENTVSSRILDKAFRGDIPSFSHIGFHEGLVESICGGGYLEALSRKTPKRTSSWYRSYVQSLCVRDVSDMAKITKVNQMSTLVTLAAHSSGQVLNMSKLGNLLGIDGKTVDRWLDLLQKLFLLHLVPAWSRSQVKRLSKAPKLHFLDSGLLASLLNVHTGVIERDRSQLGSLLECFVYSELVKATTLSEETTTISYFRENNTYEVDFVLERTPSRVVGIEVKASSTIRPDDFKGLRRLAKICGKDFICGIVLHDTDHIQQVAERLFAMPVHALWETY